MLQIETNNSLRREEKKNGCRKLLCRSAKERISLSFRVSRINLYNENDLSN